MASARARAARGRPRAAAGTGVLRECAGLALLGVALLVGLALLSYSPQDPVFAREPVANRAGSLGATAAALLFRGLGFASGVPVAVAALFGIRLAAGAGLPRLLSRFGVGVTLLLPAAAALPPLAHAAFPDAIGAVPGGWLGDGLAGQQSWLLGSWGALLANAMLLAIGVLCLTGLSAERALGGAGVAIGWFGALLVAGLGQLLASSAAALRAAAGGASDLLSGLRRGARSLGVWRERRARRARVEAALAPPSEAAEESPAAEGAGDDAAPRRPWRLRRAADPTIVDHAAERGEQESGRQESFHFEAGAGGPYRLPDLALFARPPANARSYDRESLIMNSRILEKKLADFGIGGQVDKVHPGPVVTMYEFEPASGVKLNRIVSLADDLALALRALSVRIIAPLPGKSVVGIEVANAERDTVYLRDVLEAEALRVDPSKLAIALGKDIFGNPTYAELSKMPHLLVAGATGTGKSVFLNALLCSLLCRATPDELSLLLIDPKLLELSIYEGIPHLIADVVTNPKRAAAALQGVVHKMDQRYQVMAALGVRSIQQYNARVEKELAAGNTTFRLRPRAGEEEGEEVEYRRFPYIVVVIDELADLMVVSARDVEESLQRLAQMARAAGIHLVLATQRPSVDVLTGIIKANFPARISFQVSSRTDSRTILDQNGAEHLLGQGDMLFLPPGTSKMQRVHGSFVSEEEVQQLVAFLRDQGSPVFDETLVRLHEESETREARGEDLDDLFDRAVEIVAETRNASISYIQRRLKVGYNRAARMIEQMEEEGIVGPQEGTKPREVFARQQDPLE